jgi:uncharacterized membrane protein YeaQ/YmgE (transglycosylase-associated protein family)
MEERDMWDWIVLLLVGAFIGWLASIIMRRDQQQGALMNILVGIAGAFLARWLFGAVFGIETAAAAGELSFAGIAWGIVGAVVLLFIVGAVTRNTTAGRER